jgi:hypothetical protein
MAAFGKASAPKADGSVIRSSSDKIRARMMKSKPSLKTMWSQQSAENVTKSNEECVDVAEGVEPIVDDIDPDVLSQLPPSIQAEIRMSRGDSQKTSSSSGKKGAGMNAWLTKKASASASSSDADKARPFAPFNPNDIDQDFLDELPDDIRASVMKDIAAYNHSPQRQPSGKSKRKRGIDSFFVPSKSK